MVKHKGRKTVLSLGIAIIFVMFVAYAIETFYPSPNYNDPDFCGEYRAQIIDNQEQCEAVGGMWNPTTGVPKNEITGYCDTDYTCRMEYENYSENYNRNIFFLSLAIGLITFVVAVSLLVDAVATGFMGGGVLLIVYGTIRYWGSLNDLLRTLMLGFALAVLVWIGYKKLR